MALQCNNCNTSVDHVGVYVDGQKKEVCSKHHVVSGKNCNHGHYLEPQTGNIFCEKNGSQKKIATLTRSQVDALLGSCDTNCKTLKPQIVDIMGQTSERVKKHLADILAKRV